jgi:RNA polymerase sigma factor (sigma-70 family)
MNVSSTTAMLDGEPAFVDLYRNQYQRSFRLAWLLTNGGPDCEDLVQDAFIRVSKHADRITNPPAYLRTAIVSVCRDAQRRQGREDRRLRLVAADATSVPFDTHLLALLAELPYAQRAALVLRYWVDMPDTEIAAVLGVRPTTVRSLVHRATRRLHQELSHAN